MAHYDFRADLLRSLEIFERNRALLAKQSGTVDLEAEFSRATGLSPRHFIELCLVVGTPYRMMKAGSLINNDPNFFIDKNRFGNMNLSDAEMTSFFPTVAQTAQQLADYLPTQGERPLGDSTVFQSWPVIRRRTENVITAVAWRARWTRPAADFTGCCSVPPTNPPEESLAALMGAP